MTNLTTHHSRRRYDLEPNCHSVGDALICVQDSIESFMGGPRVRRGGGGLGVFEFLSHLYASSFVCWGGGKRKLASSSSPFIVHVDEQKGRQPTDTEVNLMSDVVRLFSPCSHKRHELPRSLQIDDFLARQRCVIMALDEPMVRTILEN